jgi:hypothetical protein
LKTNCEDLDFDAIFTFIVRAQNELGIWGHSTDLQGFQLIDTFQIIRSLSKTPFFTNINSESKDTIMNALSIFQYYQGYSFIPKNKMTLPTIYSIIKSFGARERIYDLRTEKILKIIEACYTTTDYFTGFYGIDNYYNDYHTYRLKPVEFFNIGSHLYTEFTNSILSHKNTYMALQILQDISLLDEFESEIPLISAFNSIIDSQYLNNDSEFNGAFLLAENYQLLDPKIIPNTIFFENTYYAIQALKLIGNYYDFGSVKYSGFSISALYSYIMRNIVETNEFLYFQPKFTDSSEKIIEYTYYMIDILNDLYLYGLDNLKIKNYLLKELDYTNLRSFYYAYKISERLNLNIEFNTDLVYNLVNSLYISEIYEFKNCRTTHEIDQEILYFIIDLMKTSPFQIYTNIPDDVVLGNVISIETSFENLVIRNFGDSVTVFFENPSLGESIFEQQEDKTFHLNLFIPYDKKFYPELTGTIKILSHGEMLGQKNITINTNLNEWYAFSFKKKSDSISITINYSCRTKNGYIPLEECFIYAKVYNNSRLIGNTYLHRTIFPSYSSFHLNYTYPSEDFFLFDIYLQDEFHPDSKYIFSVNSSLGNIQSNDGLLSKLKISGSTIAFLSLITTILCTGSTYFGVKRIHSSIKGKNKDKKKETSKKKDDVSDRKTDGKHGFGEWK